MRAIRRSFLQMIKMIKHDLMLFASCIAPILAGIAIKFVVPMIEKMLMEWTGRDMVLYPYYGLFDLFFAALTPVMFCFIAAMVILEERDDHIAGYLYITGLGKNGYLASRFLLPSLLAFVVDMVLIFLFSLTSLSVGMIIFLAVTGTFQGGVVALMIVTLSSNKLEGMAITKMSSLVVFGAFIPYFISGPQGYLFLFLPSFWMGKALYENELIYMFPSILMGGIWIGVLFYGFQKKS